MSWWPRPITDGVALKIEVYSHSSGGLGPRSSQGLGRARLYWASNHVFVCVSNNLAFLRAYKPVHGDYSHVVSS